MKTRIPILSSLMLLLLGTQAQAVPCSDTSTGVFLSSTTTAAGSACEDGSGSNDPFPSDYIGFPDMNYDALQKINYTDGGGQASETQIDINLVITPTGAATNGTWSFTNVAEYSEYVIVLKDGGTYPDGVNWAAYLLDTSLFDATDGSTWAGDWIYGYNKIPSSGPPPKTYTKGGLKNLSHFSVYGRLAPPERPPSEGEIPAPGVLVLFGTGLALLSMRRKRKMIG